METKCQNCHKREANQTWIGRGSMMDFVHGNYQIWCKICVYEAQIKHLELELKRIPKDLKIIKKKLNNEIHRISSVSR